jgi:acetyl esterase/lipase
MKIRHLASSVRHVIRYGLGQTSGLELLNAVSIHHAAHIQKNLVYHSKTALQYDLYLPEPPTNSNPPSPVLVFFYGGSWNRGHKDDYAFVGRRLAALGYITAIPNYRVYPEVQYPSFLEDCTHSVSTLLETLQKPEYEAWNPSTACVLMGHSAGAYNAAMLAFNPKRLNPEQVKGFIGMAGPYNFYPIDIDEVKPVFHHPHYHPQSQPIDFCTHPQKPSLIVCPEHDDLVNTKKNSQALHDALLRSGSNTELHTIRGTDHYTLIATLSPLLFYKGNTLRAIQRFVNRCFQH